VIKNKIIIVIFICSLAIVTATGGAGVMIYRQIVDMNASFEHYTKLTVKSVELLGNNNRYFHLFIGHCDRDRRGRGNDLSTNCRYEC